MAECTNIANDKLIKWWENEVRIINNYKEEVGLQKKDWLEFHIEKEIEYRAELVARGNLTKKKLIDMTDTELLDMMDVPEEMLEKSVKSRTDEEIELAGFCGEMTDIVMGILEERHGAEEAYLLWMERFGGHK